MPADAEPETSGYCRDCGQYGRGLYDGIRTALTDWIIDHVGCPADVVEGEPE
ncbi:hypothetical protein ACIRD3_32150 [Kitasatospora sp. NPDC093550]|uniref:hypothetical protein n=1 Tax=Kitasatospora sp. NPDC093550 TaxID=3364089 RepID=UPI0037FB2911